MKKIQGILVFLGAFFCVISAHADVAIGTQVITTGTKIEVLEPGPDLQTIIDGITDKGESKPYLIKLGAGVYPITANASTGNGLAMAPYVSIVGSGQGVTILKGAISSGTKNSSSAIVTGASNTILADLTVENTGDSSYSIAIYNGGGAATRIERVTATASGGTDNYGVLNSASSPTMTQVTITASGGTDNYGVYNNGLSPTMTLVNATASGGTDNFGVYNANSSPTMTKVTATASDGSTSNLGVYNIFSSPTMTLVKATASGGSYNVGVYNSSSSSAPRIERSFLSGTTYAMRLDSNGTRISNSQLVGGISNDQSGDQCRDTYDENLANVTC